MKVTITTEDNEEKIVEMDTGSTVSEALNKIDVNEETVIIERSDEIISADEKLNDEDKLKLISVVSGG